MAGRAPFGLYRRVFISERALLIRVTLHTSRIPARCEPGLFQLESAVRIVAIAATHGPFQNLVVEWRRKRRRHLTVATHAQLRIVRLQHACS